MLPLGKFIDDESTSILQDIKEKEKLVQEKGIASIDDQCTISRRNILPPLTLRQNSEIESGKSHRWGAHESRPSNFVLLHRQNSDTFVPCIQSTSSMNIYDNNEIRSFDKRKFSRNASFERPQGITKEKYWLNRSIETIASKDVGFQNSSRCISKFGNSEELYDGEDSRRCNDFDAYLKHALRKREEDRLFSKSTSNNAKDHVPAGRKERPKTAHYGRRRTHFEAGNL